MPRFVILLHETPPGSSRASHYDLMLEQGDALWTWACESLPEHGKAVTAERLPDHRLAYLDYEGPVSDDRGSVRRVASGSFDRLAATDGQVRVQLTGDAFRGELLLTRDSAATNRWSASLLLT